jgi:MinD superfamily P-loop ATPase
MPEEKHKIKELVVLSGKGGTGKTSITACFATLAGNRVVVDADVDAADLHLVLKPRVRKEEEFRGGHVAIIDEERCTACGQCLERCQFKAISDDFRVDPVACEGCGVCVHFCPAEAIDFPQRTCGRWFISDTDHGPLVHARLGIAEENSGLLVNLLRKEAKALAEQQGLDTLIVDGPPGIGCPVISSLTGAGAVLIITEPTLSGLHDLERVVELAAFFNIPAMVAVNKYDVNAEVTERIDAYCHEHGLSLVGTIPYDRDVTGAMVAQQSLVEFSRGPAAEAVRRLWEKVSSEI